MLFVHYSFIYYQIVAKQTQKRMHCKYCVRRATGINYRPNSSLENIPTCSHHATSLFIPFSTASELTERPFATKLQELLQKLIDSMVAEFNLIKSERMKTITQDNAITFQMNCQITSPYIIIPADEELLLTAMIKRIKYRHEREKVYKQRSSLYGSRMIQNQAKQLTSQTKFIAQKKYLFLTPQPTERSKFETNHPIKSTITPVTKLPSNGQKNQM